VIKKGAGVSGSRLVAMKKIEIGEGSFIGGGCLICDSDMHEIPLGSENEISKKPVIIGSRVFIGAQVIILKGVSIGSFSVVGAGAVVSRDVPSGCTVIGNPARTIHAP
jgi:acetyltransferase-like isoleucine patch superfamily enzyme